MTDRIKLGSMSDAAMFTLDDIRNIIQPHNDLIAAEAKIEVMHATIFELKSALGSCAALMQSDLDCEKTAPTETRLHVVARARELSRA